MRICSASTTVACLLASSTCLPAQTTTPDRDWVTSIKQPVNWFAWGADIRLRNEYFHNAMTIDPNGLYNEQDYYRFRGRVWASLKPAETLSFNARLTTEPRVWNNPAAYTTFRGNSGTDATYGIFDLLNVQWKNAGNLPLTVTLGRQDILLGDGWLVFEGTPNDGSWTIFFDAARFTYEIKEAQTTIDLIGIAQHAEDDGWVETINNQNRLLTDQDERGLILNIANRSLPGANVEGYFIYKHDDLVRGGRFGDEADIYTAGLRFSGVFAEHWKYSAEGAIQGGQKADPSIRIPSRSLEYRDIEAFGFNGKLGYVFKDKRNNQITFAYEYLRGDDPSTEEDEMFDVLWGRWPRWSELYNIYSYVPETRVGQIANLHRFGPSWGITPVPRLECSLSYNLLFADESVPTRAADQSIFSGDGHFRGHMVQAWVRYKFNRHVSGHLWGELVEPGNFYAHDDLLSFLRAELVFSF